MQQEGIVLKTEKGKALVKFVRMSACGENCRGCGMCGGESEKWVTNSICAKEGEKVLVFLESKYVLLMCSLAYMVPVLLLIFGFWLLRILVKSEPLCNMISLFFLFLVVLAFTFIKFKSDKFKSKIVKIRE